MYLFAFRVLPQIIVFSVLVALFSSPGKSFFKGVLSSLGNLPLSIINGFSDIISYIRLYAVGLSTVLMAFLYFVLGEVPNFFYWFGYAVILGDAIFSPFNAYRMALRNFGVGGQ